MAPASPSRIQQDPLRRLDAFLDADEEAHRLAAVDDGNVFVNVMSLRGALSVTNTHVALGMHGTTRIATSQCRQNKSLL